MANPYGIEQVDVPGILSAFTTARAQRTQQLLTERAMAREDAQLERETRLRTAYAKLKIPGADGASGMSTAVSAYGAKDAAPAVPDGPVVPADFGLGMRQPHNGAIGAIALPDTSAAPQPAAAAPAPGAPPAPGATPDGASHPLQGWLDTNSGAIQDIMQQDPQSGLQIMQHFHQLDAEKQQAIKDHLAFADQVNEHGLRLLGGVKDQASWDAAKQGYNALLQQYGLPPQALPAQYDPATVKGLMTHALSVKDQIEAMKPVVLGKDSKLVNPADGTTIADNTSDDLDHFTINNADGTTTPYAFNKRTGQAFQLRDGGGAGGGSAGGTATSQFGIPDTKGPTGKHNALDRNNPGGIEDGAFAKKQPGYVPGDGSRYAAFSTIADGVNAQRALLGHYVATGRDTPMKIAQRWAPAPENDPNSYAQFIAKKLGIGVNDKIGPDKLAALQEAQAQRENGNYSKRFQSGGVSTGLTAGGAGTPITGKSGGTLTDEAAKLAAAIYKTKGTLPAGIARTKLDVDKILNVAANMSMEDAHRFADQTVGTWQDTHTAGQTLTAFAKGPEARQTRSLSVAIEHMQLYKEAALALQNGNMPAFNSLSQLIAKATGQAAPTNAQALHGLVMDEVVKGVVGASGGVQDRERAAEILKQNSSPAQFAGGYDQINGLLLGQLHGLNQQYKAGTGRDDFERFLTPAGARVFKDYQTRHGLSGATAAPKVGEVRRGYTYVGGPPGSPSSWRKQ